MELKVSYPKPGISSDYVSDPEEKDISDDEDDDRNHKHRRRETRSQSLERDAREHVLRPYGKRSKPFENGRSFRDNDSQANEAWKSFNAPTLEKDTPGKFDKRRLGAVPGPRVVGDFNQRIRGNQAFSGDLSSGRGRGRDSGTWNQFDSRFSPVDIASQIVHHGSFPPSLFAGRGLPSVSTAQTAPWNAFGLISGIPNSGLETMHPIGLQGTLRPPINPPLNIGIPRQRCRDFEERGFCLRGDMCPMEHGINRIVVEDVQSLSQFNLPLSLPNAHLIGKTTGSLPAVSTSSTTVMSGKGLLGKNIKPSVGDDSMPFHGVYSGSGSAGEADLYDPDQPLWNNNCPEKPNALSGMHSSKIDEVESFIGDDPSDRNQVRKCDAGDNGCTSRITAPSGSHVTSSSVWGRVGSRNRQDVKGKLDPVNASGCLDNEVKEQNVVLASVQGNSHQQKHMAQDDAHTKAGDLSLKAQSDANTMRTMRKPSQKATCTLFVNGIPLQSNKTETLLSHFNKYGEVIDIYIPANSQRAFVQFSKREEAEAALKSPDAVMGNRFIKLWWANRDSIPDDGVSSNNGIHVPPRHIAAASLPSLAVKGKNSVPVSTSKGSISHPLESSLAGPDHSHAFSSPKVSSPLQKKLENLEQLKEELRKKQQMLDMKRNDFRRQLDKLEKQATGNKVEAVTGSSAKRLKVGIEADTSKLVPKASDSSVALSSPHTEVNGEHPEPTTSIVQQESSKFEPVDPMTTEEPFDNDGEKLGSCSTGFKIVPPLPVDFANEDVIKQHFSSLGDVCSVEFVSEDGVQISNASNNCSANVTFLTRHSAERAFEDGRSWQGQDLKFIWLSNDKDPHHTSSDTSRDADMEPENEEAETISLNETLSHKESQSPTRDDSDEPSETGKVSAVIERET
ncbi:zinc finger CCCH domain-containing protein 41 [Cucumis sativus]|uniref:zinc finger CCCH domain-containing protein 41 n=1 Tax=Cucumis sativus TaxID=3659 RepID=UPI0002B4A5AF|nr:zinc finger CCCH domain-containing protein 41 [Cucumis sativus]XP_011652288.1 zinc finger CCCH domain-containing protein 41 [Cucumis sativus]